MLDQRNELTAWDRDHFFHPSTHMGMHARGETPTRVIGSGEGVYITDTSGKTSLDAFAGLYCVNVGYGRQKIADAIAEQAKNLAYYHSYVGHGTEASITLAKMIIDRAPEGMSRVYFGLSGSDANETNIKLIWYYNNILGRPEKKKIISRWRGYHGSGVMTGSLTGLHLFHFTLRKLGVEVTFVEDQDDRAFFDPSRKIGPQVSAALLERGVIGRAMPQGDILGFAPPLCLTREEADVVVKAAAGAIEQVLG